ncbi:MAG: HAMP domain-containing protein [Hyphomonadaceae bacterium]|nr:HAMP domain-containing protein [Hyphomonadaceae bacterium]
MKWVFDTVKGRVVAVLVLFLSGSHILGLWLYAQKSEEAATLLHDALLAEQIALVTRLAERLAVEERPAMLQALSGPTVRIALAPPEALRRQPLPEGTRAHTFEHLLGVFLDRPTQESVRLAYSPGGRIEGLDPLLARVSMSAHGDRDHLSMRSLAEIHALGAVSAEVALADGSWIRFVAPLLTVTPFSPLKLGIPLAAMLVSVLLIAAWVLHRWTQPLTQFAAAAEQFGTDIHSPPLPETGPSEVRTAARTVNLMQQRIRRLVEDRTAFAAAIAHDLGTPITRLHLRAHEIEDEAVRSRLLADLEQMRRMITSTLEFTRFEFTAEPTAPLDLASLVQSVCDDYFDAGQDVAVQGLEPVTIASRPIALRRALGNIMDNAFKYGTRARVALATTPRDVRITIHDDGPGIPPDLVEEAFRPFRRLARRNGKTDGTGLGLSIARSIIRGLGGEIALTNPHENGLLVSVILPKTPIPRPAKLGHGAVPRAGSVRQPHMQA